MTSAPAYSENLALILLDFMMHESGLRLPSSALDVYGSISDAADVCDQTVLNADGASEYRYHGSGWYRYNNRPADVIKMICEAADLMLYQGADGKIGFHGGTYVAPDITLTAPSIISLQTDLNRARENTCIAVRGRYTSPAFTYNTIDAAIYGDPYAEDDERTITVENSWVQSECHMNRLQKLRYQRANAAHVSVVAHYDAAKNVPFRRFVGIDKPPFLNNVVVELVGRPKLSLASLTVAFDGIVVPSTLYSFDAATEGGAVPIPPTLPSSTFSAPTTFAVTVGAGPVGSCSWDAMESVSFIIEYGISADGSTPPTSTDQFTSAVGTTSADSPILTASVFYGFRIQAVSPGGSRSSWSDWEYIDTTP